MDISRRGFLAGTLAISALVALPIAGLPRPPKLWGDGVHDDTEALNALFAGEPVEYDDALVSVREGGYVRLAGGHTFRISGTINVSNGISVDGGGSVLDGAGTKWRKGEAALAVRNQSRVHSLSAAPRGGLTRVA